MNAIYSPGGRTSGEPRMEKDLGVLVDDRLSNGMQCQAAVNKASRILACNKKGINSRDKYIILPLYKTLVWPHLEYAYLVLGTSPQKGYSGTGESTEKGNKAN